MFLSSSDIYWIVALCVIVAPIFILMIIALVIALVKRIKLIRKYKGVKPAKIVEGNTDLIQAFGDNNIVNVTNDMSRITVTVKDVDIVDANKIKELGAKGVLLVGDNVKFSFEENAKEVYEQLKGAISNE